MSHHAGLSLLRILQHSLGVGLVQGPTFNFMLLKREKGHRTKEGRLMPWSSPLQYWQTQKGGAVSNLSATRDRPARLMQSAHSSR